MLSNPSIARQEVTQENDPLQALVRGILDELPARILTAFEAGGHAQTLDVLAETLSSAARQLSKRNDFKSMWLANSFASRVESLRSLAEECRDAEARFAPAPVVAPEWGRP